jgi:hypothetical protein
MAEEKIFSIGENQRLPSSVDVDHAAEVLKRPSAPSFFFEHMISSPSQTRSLGSVGIEQ